MKLSASIFVVSVLSTLCTGVLGTNYGPPLCNCEECEPYLNNLACKQTGGRRLTGGPTEECHTCEARIRWLMTSDGGNHTENEACSLVAKTEFPGLTNTTCGGCAPPDVPVTSCDLATIKGHVYEDTNGNNVQDPGEPDFVGVDVVITDSGLTTQTVTTDANGDYTATVAAGTTTANIVETTLPAGKTWTQTEGTNPTTVDAPVGSTTSMGNDGYTCGDASCTPEADCTSAVTTLVRGVNLGCGSCTGTGTCVSSGRMLTSGGCYTCSYVDLNGGEIGDFSCKGYKSCKNAHNGTAAPLNIGDGSCVGSGACCGRTADVGDGECIGDCTLGLVSGGTPCCDPANHYCTEFAVP